MSNWLKIILIVFFSFMVGMFVHETYHVIEHNVHEGNPTQVCYLGIMEYNGDLLGGWVKSENVKPKSFSFPFSYGEVVPLLIQIITSTWCTVGLLFVMFKGE